MKYFQNDDDSLPMYGMEICIIIVRSDYLLNITFILHGGINLNITGSLSTTPEFVHVDTVGGGVFITNTIDEEYSL